MSEDKTLTKIPRFDGHYDHSSEMKEDLLNKGSLKCGRNWFSEQEEGTMLTEAQNGHLDDARLKDHKVKHYLFQAVDRTIFEQILNRRTTKIV